MSLRVLVTGGTGSLGRYLCEHLVRHHLAERVIVYSRDEVKQAAMQDREGGTDPRLRYILGDVRDRDKLARAMVGVDAVIHTAALARVAEGAYNVDEILKTNVIGTQHVIDAAMERGVHRVLVVTSDKGCHAALPYGTSKRFAEDLAVHANSYTFPRGTWVACCRFGNLMWSRDSVAERLLKQRRACQPLKITDKRMTRFGVPLPDAVRFLLSSLDLMRGGEVFVPRPKSLRILDLAKGIDWGSSELVLPMGLRPGGEKLHEMLLAPEEASHTIWHEETRRWVIEPAIRSWTREPWVGEPVGEGYEFTSEKNDRWFSPAELRETLCLIPSS